MFNKSFIVLVSLFSLSSADLTNVDQQFKLIGPDELTDFIVHRLGGLDGWNPNKWNEQSDDEVKRIFIEHGVRNLAPIPCLETDCKKTYTDIVSGSGTVKSEVSNGTSSVTVDGSVDGSAKFILNLERDNREEKHCLVVMSNTSLSNSGPDFSYTVKKNVTYGGGVRIKPLMAEDESNAINLEETANEGLVKLHLIWASGKSQLEETTESEHYSEKFTKSSEVTATVVTFDTENCYNSVNSVNCDTLARVYHHIKSSMERRVTYKQKSKSYKTESYGTIVTVVKKL